MQAGAIKCQTGVVLGEKFAVHRSLCWCWSFSLPASAGFVRTRGGPAFSAFLDDS